MKRATEAVDILLATYNGGLYVAQQLDSILAQTLDNWQLTIRDDGSTDDTINVLHSYQERFPDKIALYENWGEAAPGPCANFARLLQQSSADYSLLCDQDDVWLPRKAELTWTKMKELEERYGKETPLLVHTDLQVVDRDLQQLSPSFWQYQSTDPTKVALNRLLVQNIATGCTVMINRALRERALPIPVEARMHDWWLTLVAGAFGRIGSVNEATVLYRQHGQNDSGASPLSYLPAILKFINPRVSSDVVRSRREFFPQLERQAGAFLQRYNDSLGDEEREMLQAFSTLNNRNFFMRRYLTVRYGFFYSDWLMTLGMLAFR